MLINRDPSTAQVRQFARLWLPLFGLVMAGLQWSRGAAPAVVLSIAGTAAALSVVCWLSPGFARRLFVGLVLVTAPIGWVVGTALMALIYYLVLTPVALFRRWRGVDLLHLRRDAGAASYWHARPERTGVERHFSQF